MSIDLSKCVVGQKLKTRSGRIFTFVGKNPNDAFCFPYLVKTDGNEPTIGSRNKNGRFSRHSETGGDIVEILPTKKEKNNLVKQLMSRLEEAKTELDIIATERVKINNKFDNCVQEIQAIENLLKIKRKIFNENNS